METVAFKQALKEYARSVGLDLIGVAPAAPFLVEKERLEARQLRGDGPNPFEYQAIPQRVYPDMLLPGAQSIIAAGISYLTADGPDQPPDPLQGWLSRYCRGQDYHQVLKAMLTQVAEWIEAHSKGARTLVYVDTGPPLDRAVAERAGIGKFGKHTNLISPPYGTWTFLGEILTDLNLPPDEPVEAACGTCTLCLDICPTQCITEWNLDANRCLSYVTQMKGMIPDEYREVMGNRLFGCDDCQDVCPYNKKAAPGGHAEFAPVAEVGAHPSLLQLMSMTKGDFKRWFEPTAAGWRGKTTIQRNAVIALGNSGDVAAFAPIVAALASESHLVRGHAAWALGRLARALPTLRPEAMRVLSEHDAKERNLTVKQEVGNALGALSGT